MDFLQGSLDLFCEACSSMHYVVPNLQSMVMPIPASLLKLTTLDEWPEDIQEGAPLFIKVVGHFVTIHLDKITNFPIDKKILTRQYKEMMERMHINSQYTEMVRIEVLMCIRDMCKNLSVLRGHTNNEAEVRFAFGNPIVTMVCAIHGYFLTLEQRLSTPTAGTTRRSSVSSADGVTEKSVPDYVCYTIHQQNQHSQLKLAAVVVKAKCDANYNANAVAQVIGYYLRACTTQDGHTVAVLLTETKVDLLLFPFTKHGVGCVNAVLLSSLEFSIDNILGTTNMLFF